MTTGPGKYDDLCTAARLGAKARAALVIIVGGASGSGFAVQVETGIDKVLVRALPDMLRDIADQIEANVANDPPQGD